MKKENLDRLLFALIKNSKRSDRDLAKTLRVSQPTITRLRKALEKDAILQYTLIPKEDYLGFDIIALIFIRTKEQVQPFWECKSKWVQENPNVMFCSTGQGMESDAVMITVHKDYADFVKFYHKLRKDCGDCCEEIQEFIISLKGSVRMKKFSYSQLEKAYEKEAQR